MKTSANTDRIVMNSARDLGNSNYSGDANRFSKNRCEEGIASIIKKR